MVERHQQARDSRRRDALLADGFDVVTVTSSQIDSVSEFIEIAVPFRAKQEAELLRAPPRFSTATCSFVMSCVRSIISTSR